MATPDGEIELPNEIILVKSIAIWPKGTTMKKFIDMYKELDGAIHGLFYRLVRDYMKLGFFKGEKNKMNTESWNALMAENKALKETVCELTGMCSRLPVIEQSSNELLVFLKGIQGELPIYHRDTSGEIIKKIEAL